MRYSYYCVIQSPIYERFPGRHFTRKFSEQHPQVMFYKSKLTDKIMVSGYQTLNIVETLPNNQPSHSQCEQKHQLSDSNKVTILKRDYAGIGSKYQTLNIPCLLCKSPTHPADRCLQTRQLRDRERPVPLNFCEIHCGKIYALCKDKTCALITTRKQKSLDLTCQKHKTKHFLLCNKQPCHTVLEKY